MKYFITFFLLYSFLPGFGQKQSFDGSWRRSFERSFNVPDSILKDSCYYSYSLLRIDLDKKSNISLSSVSQNAPRWILNELKRIEKDGYQLLEENARREHIKNCTLVIPIVIRVEYCDCHYGESYQFKIDKYYHFSNNNLKKKIIFLNPLEV